MDKTIPDLLAWPPRAAARLRVKVLKMQFHSMTNYNYLVIDEATGQALVVDPAWQMDRIDEALEEAQAELAGVLVTHSHPDHLNLAAPLAEQRRCPIWMSEREIEMCGFRHPRLQAIGSAPWFVGGMHVQPLLTPGHTPGCVCYLIGDNLFTGDVLFAEGCGVCPSVEAAHEMFGSLEYLKALLDPQVRIYPGHSYGKVPGQLFEQVLRDNIYLHFRDRTSFANFRMRRMRGSINVFGQ